MMTPMIISGTRPTGKQQHPLLPKLGKNGILKVEYERMNASARTGI